jgi:hypothetical protein
MHNLQIKLSSDTRDFLPGETLKGELHWSFPERVQRIELRLFWVTSGRGVPETGVVEVLRFEPLAAQDARPFSFQLPPFPFSYEGRLMRLNWALEAICTPGNITAREEFTLAPDRKKIVLHPSLGSGLLKAAA